MPAAHDLRSPWSGQALGRGMPLPDYPRPMLERSQWLNLNGPWQYAVESSTSPDIAEQPIPTRYQGQLTVPFAIESVASGVGADFAPDQTLFYRRTFRVPAAWEQLRVVLNFEAVDYECLVRVNGDVLGRHLGGYLPFSIHLPPGVTDVDLVVAVRDPSDAGGQPYGKQALNPETIWYTATSGIWGTVWAEPLPDNAISSLAVTSWPDLAGVDLLVEADEMAACDVTIDGPDGACWNLTVQPGTVHPVPLPQARPWSPDDPNLYRITVTNGPDDVRSWFALRTVAVGPIPGATADERPAVLLNGQPILLNTPLDQGYWPESGMTAPCDDALIAELQELKNLGFNGVRKHIKVESRRFYHHADRIGMMVIQDMVNGGRPRVSINQSRAVMVLGLHLADPPPAQLARAGRDDPENRELFEADIRGTIDHLAPHPSVVMWVLFNEAWGQYDTHRLEAMIREADPTRLIDAASGWYDQGGGDFRSRHRYTLSLQRPPRRDRRPYFLSEFGGLNLPVSGHLWPGSQQFGYRFHASAADLAQGLSTLYRKQLIPLVENGLRACVYTQVSDVEIETNGLFTYDRILKVDAQLLRQLNGELMQAFDRLGQ
ncbi:MAG: glycoside hydrolase family 2 protein [Beutenbergiaceae bacterium]